MIGEMLSSHMIPLMGAFEAARMHLCHGECKWKWMGVEHDMWIVFPIGLCISHSA